MSQAELAALAGVGRPWLSELGTGKRTAELGRALAVLSALDSPSRSLPPPALTGRRSISTKSSAAAVGFVGTRRGAAQVATGARRLGMKARVPCPPDLEE